VVGSGGYGDGVLSNRMGSAASAVSDGATLCGLAIAILRTVDITLPPSSAMKALVPAFIYTSTLSIVVYTCFVNSYGVAYTFYIPSPLLTNVFISGRVVSDCVTCVIVSGVV